MASEHQTDGPVRSTGRGAGVVVGAEFDLTLAAARRGDERAWCRIYSTLCPVLTGYLRGNGCPSPEDTTSETLLQVVRDLHRFTGSETEFRSWVFTIARHRMIDAARARQVRPCQPAAQPELESHLPPFGFEDDALARLGTSELDGLLAGATLDQREVLLLHYVADLSLHQTAVVLDKHYGAVKALHRRGIASLRARLGPAQRGRRTVESQAA
jgi:RNA polymerase sigma factor (sigma-70 family)